MKVRQPFIIAILFAYTSAIFINLIQSTKSTNIKRNYKVRKRLHIYIIPTHTTLQHLVLQTILENIYHQKKRNFFFQPRFLYV